MIRPPVITIMGHVDHGKTTLLDYLRRSRLTAKEAGGITQHIGAYQIDYQGKKLTFIDTPGHAAFNKMRERGAAVTDIVVLVVAANDGVKPQTIESIRHIKNAEVPVIVAINKIDVEGANPINAKSQLAEHDIIVSDFGGDVESVEISAKNGTNIDNLLDVIATTAELMEIQADEKAPLEAIVIESSKDNARGPIGNIIVKNGTLSVRQDVFTSTTNGKVRQIIGDLGQSLTQILPGDPGQIIGFKDVPEVGSTIFDNEQMAREMAEKPISNDSIDELDMSVFNEDKPKLKLILKADTQGTLEAIIQNFDADSVELIASGVGEVTDTDLELAYTSGAGIIAFQVKVPNRVKNTAKATKVKIKEYKIIYELIEYIQKKMLKLMEPTIDEIAVGEAEILQIFEMKGLKIAGVRILSGEIKKSDQTHLKRGEEIVNNPVISSMMQEKQEVTKLGAKAEGGLTFRNKRLDFQVGDHLIAYIDEE